MVVVILRKGSIKEALDWGLTYVKLFGELRKGKDPWKLRAMLKIRLLATSIRKNACA